jgi:hypothetical protein
MSGDKRDSLVDELFEAIMAAEDFETSSLPLGLEQSCQSQYPTVALALPAGTAA